MRTDAMARTVDMHVDSAIGASSVLVRYWDEARRPAHAAGSELRTPARPAPREGDAGERVRFAYD